MSLPLVATDTPGCRDVVEVGVNGLLTTPHDSKSLASALIELAGNSDLRAKFGVASREIAVTKFDSQLIFGQVANLYSELTKVKHLKINGPSNQ